jgi:hypothetical protein
MSRRDDGTSIGPEAARLPAARPGDPRWPASAHAGTTSKPRTVTAEQYFDAVRIAYDTAERRVGGPVERRFRVAGQSLRLRFAGAALVAATTDALAHLTAPDEPDCGEADDHGLTVCLFDSVSTGTTLPAWPWSRRELDVRGDVPGFCDERFLVAQCWWNGVLGLLDRTRRRALFWIPDAADFPFNERGSPLLMQLHAWLRQRGLQLLHAGAVGTPEGGVLLAGRGGAGKSTTAVASLIGGLSYAADDYCVIATEPQPVAYSLYNSGKLSWNGLHRFSQLSGAAAHGTDGEKALFFLGASHPDRLALRLPIRAVLLPAIHDGPECVLEPLSRAVALRAAVSSTMAQIPGADGAVLSATAAFMRQLPCYRLRIGVDMERIAARVVDLLRA